MSAYVTQQQIFAKIATPDVIAALDDGDNADGFMPGTLNTTRLNQIISDAGTECDSFLAATYSTPFSPGNAPEVVSTAALYITLANIYLRRRNPPEAAMFVEQAEYYRGKLAEYRDKPQSIGFGFQRLFTPGAAVLEYNSWDCNSQ